MFHSEVERMLTHAAESQQFSNLAGLSRRCPGQRTKSTAPLCRILFFWPGSEDRRSEVAGGHAAPVNFQPWAPCVSLWYELTYAIYYHCPVADAIRCTAGCVVPMSYCVEVMNRKACSVDDPRESFVAG